MGEILLAEGLNSYDQVEIGAMNAGLISTYSLVILGQTGISVSQAADLRNYVSSGGRLIAFRPDAQIKDVFGLGSSQGQQTDGYLKISNTASIDGQAPGAGLSASSLQIHGTSDRFTILSGAVMLAELYPGANSPSGNPAVIANTYGSGRAVAFTYDLPESIILTRQGNPANGNIDVDGDGVLRTIDLFQKQGGGAPWVDLNNVPIPQADIQQRLFARLVKALSNLPLPQLWYFPGTAKTMLILTGDAHENPDAWYSYEINSINAHGGKITIYLSTHYPNYSPPSDAEVQAWRAQGHEFGIHPWSKQLYDIFNLSDGYRIYDYGFSNTYTSPKSRTVRNHQIAWMGWTDAVDLMASYGIRMDTDFYHWGQWLQKQDGTWAHGYVTGSGLPMKFVKSDGTILPVYQQLTQLVDEQFLTTAPNAGYINENLTGAQSIAITKDIIDASLAGYYSALMTQFHVDYYENGDPQVWAEGTMDYANSHGVPIWNADEWLTYTETRHDAKFSNITWDGFLREMSFNLEAANVAGVNLTTLLPANQYGYNLSSVLLDGAQVAFTLQDVNAVGSAFVSVPSGNHNIKAYYQSVPPTPTTTPIVTATATPTSTPTSTNTPVVTATSTPTPTNTPTAIPANGSLTQTTYGDFNQPGAIQANTHASDINGGSVVLAASFADDLNGTVLDSSRWSSGSWSGGAYTPSLGAGILTLPVGGYVRSAGTFNRAILEATAEFGAGAWQHIGFGSNGFANNQYLLFSTYTGDGHLYARVNNNSGEQRIDLGVTPTGMHRYMLDWSSLDAANDQVRFYIDGVLVGGPLAVPNSGLTSLYYYLSNNDSTANLRIDSAQAAPAYLTSGVYTSIMVDAGVGYTWSTASWDVTLPAGTSVQVETRSSSDGVNWGIWSVLPVSGGSINTTNRYMQYRFTLGTSDVTVSPIFNAITLVSNPNSGATAMPTSTPTSTNTPVVTATSTPTPTNTPTAIPANGSLTQTTYGDFNQPGAIQANTHASDINGGSVVLAASFADDLNGTVLDSSRWSSGSWSGGAYTPSLGAGILTLPVGGYVRSAGTFNRAILEATAEFGAGAWQHIGFGSNGFANNQYLLFSTYTGDGHLYARVNNNSGEQRIDLGVTPTGMHRYMLDWSSLDAANDQVRFYIDGVLVGGPLAVPNSGLTSLYYYLSNNDSTANLRIDSAQAAPAYLTSGVYTSIMVDAGVGYTWSTASWDVTLPAGTSVQVETRSSSMVLIGNSGACSL